MSKTAREKLWTYHLAVYFVIVLALYLYPYARDKTALSILMGVTSVVVSVLFALQLATAARADLAKDGLLIFGLLTMLTAIVFVSLIDLTERKYAFYDSQSPSPIAYWPHQMMFLMQQAKTWLLVGITATGASLVVAAIIKKDSIRPERPTIREKLRTLRRQRNCANR